MPRLVFTILLGIALISPPVLGTAQAASGWTPPNVQDCLDGKVGVDLGPIMFQHYKTGLRDQGIDGICSSYPAARGLEALLFRASDGKKQYSVMPESIYCTYEYQHYKIDLVDDPSPQKNGPINLAETAQFIKAGLEGSSQVITPYSQEGAKIAQQSFHPEQLEQVITNFQKRKEELYKSYDEAWFRSSKKTIKAQILQLVEQTNLKIRECLYDSSSACGVRTYKNISPIIDQMVSFEAFNVLNNEASIQQREAFHRALKSLQDRYMAMNHKDIQTIADRYSQDLKKISSQNSKDRQKLEVATEAQFTEIEKESSYLKSSGSILCYNPVVEKALRENLCRGVPLSVSINADTLRLMNGHWLKPSQPASHLTNHAITASGIAKDSSGQWVLQIENSWGGVAENPIPFSQLCALGDGAGFLTSEEAKTRESSPTSKSDMSSAQKNKNHLGM